MSYKIDNTIALKSRDFAIRTVKLYKFLKERKKESVLSKQVLRSGTSIGANVKEAIQAQSRKDFIAKMCIALKEASEVEYWLDIMHETNYLSPTQFKSINENCQELIRLLTSIIKSSRKAKIDD